MSRWCRTPGCGHMSSVHGLFDGRCRGLKSEIYEQVDYPCRCEHFTNEDGSIDWVLDFEDEPALPDMHEQAKR